MYYRYTIAFVHVVLVCRYTNISFGKIKFHLGMQVRNISDQGHLRFKFFWETYTLSDNIETIFKRKGRDLTQSYDKTPLHSQKNPKSNVITNKRHQKANSRKYQGVLELKSRVETWQVRGNWSQQLEHKQVPQWGTEPGVRKVSVPCWHATPVANAPLKPLIIGEVKLYIKVVKLVESLIGWEVTVGQGSECHLIFLRGILHIAELDPRIDHKTFWMTISSVPRGIPIWVTSITRRLRTDLGLSVGVTIATQLVRLYWSSGPKPSHQLQKLCNHTEAHFCK